MKLLFSKQVSMTNYLHSGAILRFLTNTTRGGWFFRKITFLKKKSLITNKTGVKMPPSRQLFELSNFGLHKEIQIRPLNMTFRTFMIKWFLDGTNHNGCQTIYFFIQKLSLSNYP